jgi:hypothetical protein
VNNGYPNHPLQFENANGDTLLSQQEGVTGSFEDSSDVNWVDSGESLEFTLSTDLATEIDTYRCTVHSGRMFGSITAELPAYAGTNGSVSFTTPDNGATVTAPVSFNMTSNNFTVESASNGVRDGAGHLHILVDQPALEAGEVIPFNTDNGYYHYGGGQTSAEIDLDPGDHTVRVQAGDAKHRAYDLTDSIELTVEPPADPVARFSDEQGNIGISELGEAGQAFAEGDLSITELGEVGAAFAS